MKCTQLTLHPIATQNANNDKNFKKLKCPTVLRRLFCINIVYMAQVAKKCFITVRKDFVYHSRNAFVVSHGRAHNTKVALSLHLQGERFVRAAESVEHPKCKENPPYTRAKVK